METDTLIGKWVPLLAAEAKLRLVTMPRQQRKTPIIVLEMAPLNHSGPEPGLIYRLPVKWPELVAFGKALNEPIRQAIKDGVEVVEGHNYAPVQWNLGDRSHVRLVMTADDCETVAHVIAEAAGVATLR